MSSNRPFFANFLAAFRAHSAFQGAASSGSASVTTASKQPSYQTPTTTTVSTSANNGPSNPRTITTKARQQSPGPTATAAIQISGQFQPSRQHTSSPYSKSPGTPMSPGFPIGSPRQRRGSDSSSEGFRDIAGPEKWYIGGKTAAGEERFYKLSMVKRHRSIDRLSLDRLSL